jgi:hypothetical protein
MSALLERSSAPAPTDRRGGAPSTGRRPPVRVPEALLGLVLVAAGALGAVLWHRSATDTTTVVALAADLARGEEVSAGVLMPVDVGGAEALGLVSWAQAGELLGRRAVADLPAGTPLTGALVASGVPLAPGEALAGVKVSAGAYPAGLTPGDRVDAVAAPVAITGSETVGEPVVVAEAAEVHLVEPLGDAELSQVVTLRLPAEAARVLGATVGPIRLVRVAG